MLDCEWYNFSMNLSEPQRVYRPLVLPRQSEFTIWALSILTVIGWYFFASRIAVLSGLFIFLFLILLFIGVGTSLGNWMDRNTELTMREEGISFRNGLRDVSMAWDQIKKVEVLPSRLGDTVHVVGELRHFHFRVNSEVQAVGGKKARIGFEKGTEIIGKLISQSRLERTESGISGVVYTRME